MNEPVMNPVTVNEFSGNAPAMNHPDGAAVQNVIPKPKRMGQKFRKMQDDFQFFGIGCFIYNLPVQGISRNFFAGSFPCDNCFSPGRI